MLIKEILLEGGWASTVTQEVVLTPKVVQQATKVIPRFEKDLNDYLQKINLEPIEIGKFLGSSAYYERDLKNNPEKEYGDIDILFKIPRIEGMTESKNTSMYVNATVDFILHHSGDYVYKEGNQPGKHVILKVPAGWVQVDLVRAFKDTSEWAAYRMTPEHNMKGSLLGFLYSALAEVLHLSIGSLGVQAKEKGGKLVPFKTLKADKVNTISKDIEKFGIHVAQHAIKNIDPDKKNIEIHPLLKANPGMNTAEIKAKDLAMVLKGIGKTFELNGVFGKGHLKTIRNYEEFIEALKFSYQTKIDGSINATKFDKAETDAAKLRAEKTKETLRTLSKQVARYLDD